MIHSTDSTKNIKPRVFLYGCGLHAPGADSVKTFLSNIWEQKTSLTPEPQLNNAFLVGKPAFDFEKYRDWISSRHAPARYNQIVDKGSESVSLALGSTIDALESNTGLEQALKKLDSRVGICLGTGLGELPTIFAQERNWLRSTWEWNHFWADSSRNIACNNHLSGACCVENAPQSPLTAPSDSYERIELWRTWDAFWAEKSDLLKQYVADFIAIEQMSMGGDVATDKLKIIRNKSKACKQLQEKYNCPQPPWESVSPNLLWNLPNGSAAQVSMTLDLHGPTFSANGACATFGLLLREALNGIAAGQIDAAIVGSVDNTPPPEVVAAFYSAKVLATGTSVSVPLTEMRGTHVAGGSCIWIIATEEAMQKLNMSHMGVEILGVGVSSDAEHIITPSKEGPKLAIRNAFAEANITPLDIDTWDLHATATPGDFSELTLLQDYVNNDAVITARKGLFGHGMGSNGGWEITAQILGMKKFNNQIQIPPCGINPNNVHSSISSTNRIFALNKPVSLPANKNSIICGKLSMGVGGISSCVITQVTL